MFLVELAVILVVSCPSICSPEWSGDSAASLNQIQETRLRDNLS